MIKVEQIRNKALRLWTSGKVLQNIHGLNDIFPYKIPAGKPTAAVLMDNFAAVADWIEALHRHSEEQHGAGYQLQMTEINHRSFGKQSLPQWIVFDDPTHLIAFINKQKEADFFEHQLAIVGAQLPELRAWCLNNPIRVIEQREVWSRLIQIVSYFQEHPQQNCYIRELEIEGIDSKLIEQHRGSLTQLLDAVLKPSELNTQVKGLAQHGFERRYGLKYDPPMIRFRSLHNDVSAQFAGVQDLSLPISEFAQLNPSWSRVFITENKINGLSFPSQPGSIVIFGLGYGVSMLEDIAWLKDCKIKYWGDIDTHGFSILSTLRGYHPHTESMLMDMTTLLKFKPLWGKEPESKRFMGELRHLNTAERSLYERLVDNFYGERIRLEQERIGYQWVLEQIKQM